MTLFFSALLQIEGRLTEVHNQKTALSASQTSITTQLETAKTSFVSLVNSESLKGDVKGAIDAKISNHQVPLLMNFSNALAVLSAQYDKTIEQFKSTVSETAADAIIDTDYLQGLLDGFSSIETNISTVNQATANIYSSISDILSLTNPDASAITTPLSEGKTILTDTKTNMASFNGWKRGDEYSKLLQVQATALKGLEGAGKSSFTSKEAQAFYKDTAFMDGVEEVTNSVSNSTPIKLLAYIAKNIDPILKYLEEEKQSIIEALGTEGLKAASTKAGAMVNSLIRKSVGRKLLQYGVRGANFVMINSGTRTGTQALARAAKSLARGEKIAGWATKFGKFIGGHVDDVRVVRNAGKINWTFVKDDVIRNMKSSVSQKGFGAVKQVGAIGTVLALKDGWDTFQKNRGKYGDVHAAADGVAHAAGTFSGAVVGAQVGAVIGSAIPIPVVGTVIGTVAGTIIGDAVGKGINHVWDEFSHGEWKLPKLW
ncbi:T7SS effector LXG polymorphic toxin [uncultured Streptococcus sp.]|uniref:T7SS effector LXG polymorphic toxin n=1 Tax=uncultured Streptococcus sp. TaxID=83427 RepID=UPI0025CFE3F7|nr:T7SS effector LXG polymorphic toxin [uncultured Streptococcus sp.]